MVVSHSLLCVVFSHFENYAQAPPNARPNKSSATAEDGRPESDVVRFVKPPLCMTHDVVRFVKKPLSGGIRTSV